MTARGRRRDRDGGPSLAPVPRRLVNPHPPLRALSDDAVEAVLDAAHRILAEGGVEVRSARARAALVAHGGVEGEDAMVRLPRDAAEALLATAPATFTLRSRNPLKDVHFGGDVVNFCAASGAPNVADRLRGRRFGDISAMREIVRLNCALGAVHVSGGEVVEPIDVPVPLRPAMMAHAHITEGDLVWAARGIGREPVEDAVAMTCLARGITRDDLRADPSLLIVTNANSPRRLDEELLEGAIAMAEMGQCVIATPFTLAGAMAPVTLAGALALQTAEAVAIMAIVQAVNPGAPVVYGGFTSNVDMKSGSPAFGTPEYVRATLAGGQMARRLGVPYRTSGPTSSTSVDAQAAWETQFSLFAAIMAHGNLIVHAAGWLEGGLTNSLEKIVVDTEILRGWAESLRPVDASPADLAVDDILAIPPGGHFFGAAHTMSRFETAFHRPLVADVAGFEAWKEKGSEDAATRATAVWQRVLADYEPPPLPADVREALDGYVAQRAALIPGAA